MKIHSGVIICNVLYEAPSLYFYVSPEDALGLSSTQGQYVLRELHLHPGQFSVWEEPALPLHDLLQSAAEQRRGHDGVPAVINLFQSWLSQTLKT